MDFTRALTFPFDDQDWLKKLGIAVLVQFIPLIGSPIALQGWSYEISRRVKNNDPTPLPNWSDFGGLISKGLLVFLATLIYQLPTIIFLCVAGFVFVLPAMGGENSDAVAALGSAAVFIYGCCLCLVLIYAILAGLTFFGGYIRFLDTGEFGTFMQFGENIALVRNNMGDFGMALLYFILAGLVVGLASSVTFGLIGLVASPFYSYFGGHILGQLAAKLSGAAAMAAVPQV